MRRDAKAVDGLIARLKDADAEVASAAAVALGRIGTGPAAKSWSNPWRALPAAVRSAVAEGCILCAERSLAEGQAAEAVKLYDAVRKADVPKQRVSRRRAGRFWPGRRPACRCWSSNCSRRTRHLFAIGLRDGPRAGRAAK